MNIEELQKILVCPVCRGDLEYLEEPAPGFQCVNCGLVYPVRDDIPIMIPEDALPLEDWNRKGE